MALITRTAKGSRLTIEEMDGNLLYLQSLAQTVIPLSNTMKHLNNYKIFENKRYHCSNLLEDIDKICRDYDIENYTINDDGSIDVDGDVELWGNNLYKIPLKFNRVTGDFNIQNNDLTSLKGSPEYVGGGFYFQCNKITSLEGSPKYVGGNFACSGNKITSLEGCPEFIGGEFYCIDNPIDCITKYFIKKENKNNLIELFNYYDIVQDMNVIYDRLKYFYEAINEELTDEIEARMLERIKENGYKIIY